MRVGIAGTGRVGTAIARRLIETGHEVQVWNRTGDNAREALDAGADWAESPGALAGGSETVISLLSGDAAVEVVYLGAKGLLAGPADGRLFIDASTVRHGLHERIAAASAAQQAAFVECPMSGSLSAAQSGALIGFAGGEHADVVRALPLLRHLCRHVDHVGPLGAGTQMKASAKLLLTVAFQVLGEALLMLDPEDLT